MTVAQWSTTAALNVLSSGIAGTGGVDIDEGCAPSGVNNAMRDMMAQWATFITSATFTGTTPATLNWADNGATVGPTFTLLRTSTTPAASDIIGRVLFQGKDSAANTEDYAEVDVQINDATSTSEDATIRFRNKVAGTMTTSGSISATGYQGAIGQTTPAALTCTTFTSTGIDDNATAERVQITDTETQFGTAGGSGYSLQHVADANFLNLQGGSNTNSGRLVVYGSTHATLAGDILFETNSATVYQYDFSATQHQITGATYISGATRVGQNTTDTPGSGNNTTGLGFSAAGAFYSSHGSTSVINRTSDGTPLSIASGGTTQGGLSVSGATVAVVAFFGAHWSQVADGSKPDILRGTICDSLDQMCEWPQDIAAGKPNERLPRFKISDTPSSKAVYGVFAWWEHDPEPTNDAYIGSLGAYMVRMDAGQVVQIGDYIESAGNGCGRVQVDDILRASTVAKITSTAVIETYPDGSYLVPATLHCG